MLLSKAHELNYISSLLFQNSGFLEWKPTDKNIMFPLKFTSYKICIIFMYLWYEIIILYPYICIWLSQLKVVIYKYIVQYYV